MLLIITASHDYDALQWALDQPRSFRSFLYQVVAARSHNFLRDLRRHGSRGDAFAQTVTRAESQPEHGTTGKDEDPAAIAKQEELIAQVRQAAEQFDDDAQQIWRLLEAGMKRSQLGDALGISYAAGRRRYHRCVAQFGKQLHSLKETA